jgi:UDPglucose 6-dehydrogenase
VLDTAKKPRVAVYGLWHLGVVTAACMAEFGFDVVAIDENQAVIDGLRVGDTPVFEPSLPEIILNMQSVGRLSFSSDINDVRGCDILWITIDTPVDDNDYSDVESVIDRSLVAAKILADGAVMLVSSQLPVGSCEKIIALLDRSKITVACVPENLKLGRAVENFRNPDAFIVGVDTVQRKTIDDIFLCIYGDKIIYISICSAELVKHFINSFLALSVAFTNEIARICERFGADALEVERGVRFDARIGAKSYVKAGGAFSGGTLARDVRFLEEIVNKNSIISPVISAIMESNARHKNWVIERLNANFSALEGKKIAILGLSYKAGTGTLRRSAAVELAKKIHAMGADVFVYDPKVAINELSTCSFVVKSFSYAELLEKADVLIVDHLPDKKDLALLYSGLDVMHNKLIIDVNSSLSEKDISVDIKYEAVGRL